MQATKRKRGGIKTLGRQLFIDALLERATKSGYAETTLKPDGSISVEELIQRATKAGLLAVVDGLRIRLTKDRGRAEVVPPEVNPAPKPVRHHIGSLRAKR